MADLDNLELIAARQETTNNILHRMETRRVPGTWTIAWGVFWGLVLYSLVGVVITILCWTMFWAFVTTSTAKAVSEAEERARQQKASQVEAERQRLHQVPTNRHTP